MHAAGMQLRCSCSCTLLGWYVCTLQCSVKDLVLLTGLLSDAEAAQVQSLIGSKLRQLHALAPRLLLLSPTQQLWEHLMLAAVRPADLRHQVLPLAALLAGAGCCAAIAGRVPVWLEPCWNRNTLSLRELQHAAAHAHTLLVPICRC